MLQYAPLRQTMDAHLHSTRHGIVQSDLSVLISGPHY